MGRESERYEELLENGHYPAQPCPVCTGDRMAIPCSEECMETMFKAERFRLIASYKESIALCLKSAHKYKAEGYEDDRRIVDCLRQVRRYRHQVRVLRAMQPSDVPAVIDVALATDAAAE